MDIILSKKQLKKIGSKKLIVVKFAHGFSVKFETGQKLKDFLFEDNFQIVHLNGNSLDYREENIQVKRKTDQTKKNLPAKVKKLKNTRKQINKFLDACQSVPQKLINTDENLTESLILILGAIKFSEIMYK